jgi:deoxyinosine 3'endonuclease (endonuclease V)
VDVRYSFKDLLKESFDVVFVDGQGAISQGST